MPVATRALEQDVSLQLQEILEPLRVWALTPLCLRQQRQNKAPCDSHGVNSRTSKKTHRVHIPRGNTIECLKRRHKCYLRKGNNLLLYEKARNTRPAFEKGHGQQRERPQRKARGQVRMECLLYITCRYFGVYWKTRREKLVVSDSLSYRSRKRCSCARMTFDYQRSISTARRMPIVSMAAA